MSANSHNYASAESYWIVVILAAASAGVGLALGEKAMITAAIVSLALGWPLSRLITGIRKRIIFRAKKREIKAFHQSLIETTPVTKDAARDDCPPATIKITRHGDPPKDLQPAERVIRDDFAAMVKNGIPPRKDLYMFLRSLRVAGSIRFYNETGDTLRSFDETLADAIDTSETRMTGCVGNGGERWTAAQIHFDTDWKRGIVPLFKTSVCIISMPGCTPSCLEESRLIRSRPELLEKTVFVLPPLCCYRPPLDPKTLLGPKTFGLEGTYEAFQTRMIQIHHDDIGLHFPPPEYDRGYFVTMDQKTGNVLNARPWKMVNLTTTYASGRSPTRTSFPSLDENDIRAAVGMVLRRRGFL